MCVQQKMGGWGSQPHCDSVPAQLTGTGTQEKAPETCDDGEVAIPRDCFAAPGRLT